MLGKQLAACKLVQQLQAQAVGLLLVDSSGLRNESEARPLRKCHYTTVHTISNNVQQVAGSAQ